MIYMKSESAMETMEKLAIWISPHKEAVNNDRRTGFFALWIRRRIATRISNNANEQSVRLALFICLVCILARTSYLSIVWFRDRIRVPPIAITFVAPCSVTKYIFLAKSTTLDASTRTSKLLDWFAVLPTLMIVPLLLETWWVQISICFRGN
jgi:hypothetical protein